MFIAFNNHTGKHITAITRGIASVERCFPAMDSSRLPESYLSTLDCPVVRVTGLPSAQQEMYKVELGAGKVEVLRVYGGRSTWWNFYIDSDSSPFPPKSSIKSQEMRGHQSCAASSEVLRSGENWAAFKYCQGDARVTEHMVRSRFEYGHLEDHPRHGRLPEGVSLGYCKHLLTAYFHPLCKDHWARPPADSPDVTPQSLLALMMKVACAAGATSRLKSAIDFLSNVFAEVQPLRAVVCHCDLQPQNAAFRERSGEPDFFSMGEREQYVLGKIFDYEESRFCDPRFELMFMCRKVLSNVDDAEVLWSFFGRFAEGEGEGGPSVGELWCWLALECLHTMVCDLVSLERNLWIKKQGRGRSSASKEGNRREEAESKEGKEWSRWEAIVRNKIDYAA